MQKICILLEDKTAQRFREHALKETGSMKGLSTIGNIAIREYLDKNIKEE